MHGRVLKGINKQGVIFFISILLLSIITVPLINAFQYITTTRITVPQFVPAWSYTPGGSTITSSPVAFKGMLYLVHINRIDAVEAASGIKRWSFTSTAGTLSSPTVTNGIVYIYSLKPGTIYALDAASGVEKWHFAIDINMNCSSLLRVVNGVVYAIDNRTDFLYVLNALSGAVLWRYTTYIIQCDLITVANGAIFITTEDNANGEIFEALNISSGVKIWSYPIKSSLEASPAFADDKVYIVSSDGLDALSAGTGIKQWSYPIKGTFTAPIVMKGTIYIGSSEATSPKGNGRVALHALSAAAGKKVWDYQVGFQAKSEFFPDYYGTFTPLAILNGVVYADLSAPSPGSDEILYALNAPSGKKLWSTRLGVQDPISASLVAVHGILYADTAHWGKLYALNIQSGAQLLSYLMTDPSHYAPVVANNMAYFATTTSLYAFTITFKETPPSPSFLKTTMFSPARPFSPASVPAATTAPSFADVSGLHIESTDNIQCSKTLVLASDRLTYNQEELQQMRNYLHQLALANAPDTAPPSVLRWVPGSNSCSLSLQVSNTGGSSIQLHSVGLQLTSPPRDNSEQRFHEIDFCSVASREDTRFFDCLGGRGSGGGGCSLIEVDITLKADVASGTSFTAPLRGGNNLCFEPTLHPNDTIDIEMNLTSPGKTPDTSAAYSYAYQPVMTISDSRGSHTLPLTSMAANADFLNRQQFSCYAIMHETTFAPNNSRNCIQN